MCRWVPITLCFLFILLVLVRIPVVLEKKQSAKMVVNIQAQKTTMEDVLGTHLPPMPDQTQNNATLAGLDSNNNGIRDDIELALFQEATTSLRIRAAELQYVLAKQLIVTDVFDNDTWVAFAVQENRAFQCLGQTLRHAGVPEDDLLPTMETKTEELKGLILNTNARQDAYEKNMHFITGYALDASHVCDVDPTTLPN